MSVKTRILELRTQLREHNYKYYVLNEPIVSDYDFDMLLKELEILEIENPEFDDENSPTKRIGGDITKNFSTIKHLHPMLSLSNSYSITEIRDFENRIKKLSNNKLKYLLELKYDGVAISITYKDGKLLRAVTRGDGVKGEEVTANVRTIKSLPLVIKGDYPKLFEVRGEIILPHKAFIELNIEKEEQGDELFSNPRNTASGSVKMQDSSIVAKRKLDCYIYSFHSDNNFILNSSIEAYKHLKSWGFKTPSLSSRYVELVNSINEIENFINYWDKQRNDLPFDIDGIVIKVDDLNTQQHLGSTAKSPRWATAFKFKANRVMSTLLDIKYQVGRTGAITPVAYLDAVEISGTIVKRASIHNADQIKKLDLRIGDTVYIEKGGEIIPKIVEIDLSKRNSNSIETKFISLCPECSTELVRIKGDAKHYCINHKYCPPQIKSKIEHFVGRKQMNIDGFGTETVELLYNEKLINSIADIYYLNKEVLLPLERMAKKSVENLLESIKESKNIPFDRVLFALGIRYVGTTVAKKLAYYFETIDNIINATKEDLIQAEEIGDRIADSIIEYFSNNDNILLIDKLKEQDIQFVIVKTKQDSNIFENKSIVVSGKFIQKTRDEIKGLIERNGGKVVSSVSSNTHLIVSGENMGPSKLAKAKKLDILIYSEQEFLLKIEHNQQFNDENNIVQTKLDL